MLKVLVSLVPLSLIVTSHQIPTSSCFSNCICSFGITIEFARIFPIAFTIPLVVLTTS